MRVVIISMAARAVETYAQILTALGHETVGVLTARSTNRPEALADVLANTPPGLDAVVVGSQDRVAPLLRSYEPDLAICSGFWWKLDAEALAVPPLGVVNGHPSLLPRWRGPNPFGWTLRSGDDQLGLTFHLMDADFDTGPILAQDSVPLADDDSISTLFEKLGPLGSGLLPQALERIEAGDRGDPQSEEGASYAPRFEDEYAEIDWTRPAREVHYQARCWFLPTVSGIMGPLATLDGKRVRVLETKLVDAESEAAPGTILERDGETLLVACGDGPIRVLGTEPARDQVRGHVPSSQPAE
jgi:methionyl-tRNA formyltransferase